MDSYTFKDALSGSTISCTYPGLQALEVKYASSVASDSSIENDAILEKNVSVDGGSAALNLPISESLFFPGCSFINYSLPLVQSVYDLLQGAGRVDGISLLCCGKILSFEPNGKEIRASFEEELRDHVAAAGVKRIICACPNCVRALRDAFADDPRVHDVEMVALPVELAQIGYRIDGDTVRALVTDELMSHPKMYEVAARLLCESESTQDSLADEQNDAVVANNDGEAAIKMEKSKDIKVTIHDSCPDRPTQEFARGLRELLPEDVVVEAAHNRATSFCCGSLARAAGNDELADRQAREHGQEACDASASAIVVACMSCAWQLSFAQGKVPVFHYLELLYNWRIDWIGANAWMKLRFLFEGSLGVEQASQGGRAYVGLGGATAAAVADAGAQLGVESGAEA